jgi:hypothetical protein
MATIEEARNAKVNLRRRLDKVAGIRGVGIARLDGGWCVQVNVLIGSDPSALHIPTQMGRVPVCTRYVGPAKAHAF